MTLTSAWDIQILKRTCFGEARDTGPDGIAAQAWSMVNRHAAGRWYSGANYAAMCLLAIDPRYPQFDCWLSHDAHGKPIADWVATVTTDDTDGTMQQCLRAVLAALSGAPPDTTGGATHYFDTSIEAPPWTAPPAIFTKQVGTLRFYRNVD